MGSKKEKGILRQVIEIIGWHMRGLWGCFAVSLALLVYALSPLPGHLLVAFVASWPLLIAWHRRWMRTLESQRAALQSERDRLESELESRLASKEEKLGEMRKLWNELSRKSKLGFVSHLQEGATWDIQEFHLAGIRFVDRMVNRFEDYGNVELSCASILEIGCGVGRFVKPLACRFKYVCGVDISEEMIKVAEDNCSCLPNVTLIVNDGTSLKELVDNSFDYCVGAGVFQHITHIEVIIGYIQEAIRVLKPGGVFLFQFEGNKTEPIGRGAIGARITARDLDAGLNDLPYKIREVSVDPADPVRNVVIVIQKLEPGEVTAEANSSFRKHKMTERRWLSGVYDDIRTKTRVHERLKEEPRRLTFYD